LGGWAGRASGTGFVSGPPDFWGVGTDGGTELSFNIPLVAGAPMFAFIPSI
jgi:hypothetical protein